MENNNNLSQQDLIKRAFTYLNSFKRHRALEKMKRYDKEFEKATYHQLKQYEMFDNLELTLRAIQKGEREINED
jgi:hypothetical protein